MEEEKRSFRGAREEMKGEPHNSLQANRGAGGLVQGAASSLPSATMDPKARTQSNWNEEIINTSKEIHGEESAKSRAEMASQRSSGPGLEPSETNPNFRSPQ